MKEFKKNKGLILLSLLSVSMFTIILLNGCEKPNARENALSDEKNLSPSQMAKNHFAELEDKERLGSAKPTLATKPKSTKDRVTPLSKMSPNIIWDDAMEVKREKLTYRVVPVKDDMKSFNDKKYEFFRTIIFYGEEGGKNNMLILEVLSKKGESLGNDFQKIAAAAFENKYFSRLGDIGGLNAYVLFFNENYREDASFQLTDGKWAPARVSFRSDLEITQ